MDRTRVLIADDHQLFREALRNLLDSIPDEFEIVGEAANGGEAVVRAADLTPQVILMDIEMPELDGIEATRRILETNPEIGVVVITMHEADDLVFAAMRTGARGYILKSTSDYAEMLRVIRAVATGEAHFGPEIAKRLMGFFSGSEPVSPETSPKLTAREREILDLIAQDRSGIAGGSPGSSEAIRHYGSSIIDKLQAADRAQAIDRAREAEQRDNT